MVPASAVPANGLTATGRPAPTSTAQSSTGRVNTALTSTGRNSTTHDSTALNTTGRVSTGPGSSTGQASVDRNSTGRTSTSMASTDPGSASQASTGPGRLDRLARDRPGPGRSRRDRRAHTARRTRTCQPGSPIPTRARVLTHPAHTRMAPGRPNTAPAAADRCRQDRRGPAGRARITGRDRQAGRPQGRWAPGPPARGRWGLARADAHGTGAARASTAAPNSGQDNRDRAPPAPAIPARPRTGRARARDRAGRAGAGRPPDSTSQATGPAALAVPDARDGSATRRLAAPGLVPGMPGRGIGPAAP
jgi:hypothetical protein